MFTKLPNSLQMVLQIGGAVLVFFSLIKTQEVARDGQRYFEKVNPTIEQIRKEAIDSLSVGVTISIDEEQFLELWRATLEEPSTTFEASTLTLFFYIGVLCFFGTRPTYRRLPDRSTSPND